MHTRQLIFSALALLFAGCATPYQGIKFRSQGPALPEAYRKLTLALTVDGYTITSTDPERCTAETDWRPLTAKERGENGNTEVIREVAAKVSLRLEPRGRMYDVFLMPWIRAVSGQDTVCAPAPAKHPLRLKWQRTITTLLEKEAKEED